MEPGIGGSSRSFWIFDLLGNELPVVVEGEKATATRLLPIPGGALLLDVFAGCCVFREAGS
jgi:hypothetical protein